MTENPLQGQAPGDDRVARAANVVPFPNASETQALRGRIAHQMAIVMIVVAIGVSASTATSVFGMNLLLERDGGLSFQTTGSALIIALAVAAMQVVGWWVILDAESYRTFWRSAGAFLAAVAFLFFGFGTSTFSSWTAVQFPSAVMSFHADRLDGQLAALADLRGRLSTMGQLQPLVEAEREAACAAYAAERDGGAFSGSAGSGVVAGALSDLCQRATSMAASLEAEIIAQRERFDQADALISEYERKLGETDAPILEREREYLRIGREIDLLIAELAGNSLVESIEAFFQTLTTAVAELDDPRGDLARRQAQALSGLRQGFEERIPIIRDLIARISETDIALSAPLRRPSTFQMMIASIDENPQLLLVCAGIDAFAFFMAGVMLLKRPSRRRFSQPASQRRAV